MQGNRIETIPSSLKLKVSELNLSKNDLKEIQRFEAPLLELFDISENDWLEDISQVNFLGRDDMMVFINGLDLECSEIFARQCRKDF